MGESNTVVSAYTLYQYTHFNTLKKKVLGKHCGER